MNFSTALFLAVISPPFWIVVREIHSCRVSGIGFGEGCNVDPRDDRMAGPVHKFIACCYAELDAKSRVDTKAHRKIGVLPADGSCLRLTAG